MRHFFDWEIYHFFWFLWRLWWLVLCEIVSTSILLLLDDSSRLLLLLILILVLLMIFFLLLLLLSILWLLLISCSHKKSILLLSLQYLVFCRSALRFVTLFLFVFDAAALEACFMHLTSILSTWWALWRSQFDLVNFI
jgi:hypothetical protein